MEVRMITRRSFLTGSALLFAVPVLAATQAPQEKPKQEKPKDPLNPFNDDKSSHEKTYTDKEGNQYRICPQCGYNMYKQGRTWTCENCGYSYVE